MYNCKNKMILDKINDLLKEVETLTAHNADEVEQLRLKYLSKKGEITALMQDLVPTTSESSTAWGEGLLLSHNR